MRKAINIIMLLFAIALFVISCSDYNIYTANKMVCKVGSKSFLALQDAVDYVVSTGGKENTIVVLINVDSSDSKVDGNGVVVPFVYNGDIIFDFGNHSFFSSNQESLFVFDGGKNITIKNGNIDSSKSIIKANNVNLTVENCTIYASTDSLNLVNSTATISKGCRINGNFKLDGKSSLKLKGGYLDINSLIKSDISTILFYEGSVRIKHELETLVDKAISDVPVAEQGEVLIEINHGPCEIIPKKAATCFESGWIEHCKCKTCGKSFKDHLLTQELSKEELIIPQLKHQIDFFPAKESSCIEFGWNEHYRCNLCSTYFKDKGGNVILNPDEVIIPSHGHSRDVILGQDNPDQHWFHCNVDNVDFGHEEHAYDPWQIDQDGYKRTCRVCGRVERCQDEHRWIKVNRVEATCTSDGNIEYWYCEIHPEEYTSDSEHLVRITKEDTVIAKLGHMPFKWSSDIDYHWQFCPRCNEEKPGTRGKHDYEICYIYDDTSRNLSITSKCTVCKHEEAGKLDTPTGAFDITTSSGGISATRKGATSWTISLSEEMMSQYHSCKWTDEKNIPINIEGKDSFSITYVNGTQGHYVIMCHLYDVFGNEKEICFVQISI